MPLSLQDQLLKAGLADKKQARKIKQQKHKQVKVQQKQKVQIEDEAKVAAKQAIEAKQEKDKLLAEQQREARHAKEILAQAVNLVRINAVSRKHGDTVLNFTHDNKVKRIYVSAKQHSEVTDGRLAVVSIEDSVYELVPSPVADKIAQRRPELVIYRADMKQSIEQNSEQDDWYADYEIPDDLMW